MGIGYNIQYYRKLSHITQQELADKMEIMLGVLCDWEKDIKSPEIPEIIKMSNILGCTFDELLKEDLFRMDSAFSDISLKEIKGFRMGRYVMITPNPENDIHAYLEHWATNSGYFDKVGYEAKRLEWDFPFVPQELKTRFGLRGCVGAYILPKNFEPKCPGLEIVEQGTADYLTITITNPFEREFELIHEGYRRLSSYMEQYHYRQSNAGNCIPNFRAQYTRKGTTYMELCIHVEEQQV